MFEYFAYITGAGLFAGLLWYLFRSHKQELEQVEGKHAEEIKEIKESAHAQANPFPDAGAANEWLRRRKGK